MKGWFYILIIFDVIVVDVWVVGKSFQWKEGGYYFMENVCYFIIYNSIFSIFGI